MSLESIHEESQVLERRSRSIALCVTWLELALGVVALLGPHVSEPGGKTVLFSAGVVLTATLILLNSQERRVMRFARLGRFAVVTLLHEPTRETSFSRCWNQICSHDLSNSSRGTHGIPSAADYWGGSRLPGGPLVYSALFTNRIHHRQMWRQIGTAAVLVLAALSTMAYLVMSNVVTNPQRPVAVVDALFNVVLFGLAAHSAKSAVALHDAVAATRRVLDIASKCGDSSDVIFLLAYYEIVRSGSPHTSTKIYLKMKPEIERQWAKICSSIGDAPIGPGGNP